MHTIVQKFYLPLQEEETCSLSFHFLDRYSQQPDLWNRNLIDFFTSQGLTNTTRVTFAENKAFFLNTLCDYPQCR